MANPKKPEPAAAAIPEMRLSAVLSKDREYQKFKVWIIGETPLICHAWSHKAKLEMLQKQVKATKPGKEAREPQLDFVNSLYAMEKDADDNPLTYGFPVTGFKKAFLSVAHKDKGMARTSIRQALWLDATMTPTMPALAGAMCDMPLVRIYGLPPAMREDMGRIGSGLTKTANLIYRAQFNNWAVRITGRYNTTMLDTTKLLNLIVESGTATGVGEWRNEKDGAFGSYRAAENNEEEEAWEAFAAGIGPMPITPAFAMPMAAE